MPLIQEHDALTLTRGETRGGRFVFGSLGCIPACQKYDYRCGQQEGLHAARSCMTGSGEHWRKIEYAGLVD